MIRSWVILLLMGLYFPMLATAGERATEISGLPVPWGDLLFVDDHRLLVPYATVETATAAERDAARAELERWRQLPVGQIVDELTHTRPDAKSIGDRLARALTQAFVESVRNDPELARHQIKGMRWVRELGLRLLELRDGQLKEKRRIPIWHGRARVETRTEQVPGNEPVRVELANLRVGILRGNQYLVSWVQDLPGAVAVFLDPETLQPETVEPGFVPLAWVDDTHLLGWRRNARGTPMVGIYALAQSGQVFAFSAGDRTAPHLLQSRPLYSGAPPRAAQPLPAPVQGAHERAQRRQESRGGQDPDTHLMVLCSGSRVWLLDLHTGQRKVLGKQWIWSTCPRRGGPFLWATILTGSGSKLVALERAEPTEHTSLLDLLTNSDPLSGSGLQLAHELALPAGGFWFGPAAATADGLRLWLLHDLGQGMPGAGPSARGGTTARHAELWRYDLVSNVWSASRLAPIPLDSGRMNDAARLLAISPDGRWLAVRTATDTVRLIPISGQG